jgi:GalNAc5-diNAcBac-PP-undecaprenol beta-1,3-glucosyltransferase
LNIKKLKTITVVITNHNRPKIILPVIESIVNQPLNDIAMDILIIDDASTKQIDSKDLEKYGEKVKLHRLEKNVGVHVARNIGISLAKGEFVIIADDDDPFIPNSLQKAVDLITSLDGYLKYPMFQVTRTNGIMPCFYLLATEKHFFEKAFKGDFTPIINKKVFLDNGFVYPEYEDIKQIGSEILLSYEIADKFGMPTWNYSVVQIGNADTTTNRLTHPDNWFLKAKQFAKLQEFELEYMKKNGFDKQYPEYYNFKIKGLYIYTLLDNRRKKAREILKSRLHINLFTKFIFLFISYLPLSFINKLLKIYRTTNR